MLKIAVSSSSLTSALRKFLDSKEESINDQYLGWDDQSFDMAGLTVIISLINGRAYIFAEYVNVLDEVMTNGTACVVESLQLYWLPNGVGLPFQPNPKNLNLGELFSWANLADYVVLTIEENVENASVPIEPPSLN